MPGGRSIAAAAVGISFAAMLVAVVAIVGYAVAVHTGLHESARADSGSALSTGFGLADDYVARSALTMAAILADGTAAETQRSLASVVHSHASLRALLARALPNGGWGDFSWAGPSTENEVFSSMDALWHANDAVSLLWWSNPSSNAAMLLTDGRADLSAPRTAADTAITWSAGVGCYIASANIDAMTGDAPCAETTPGEFSRNLSTFHRVSGACGSSFAPGQAPLAAAPAELSASFAPFNGQASLVVSSRLQIDDASSPLVVAAVHLRTDLDAGSPGGASSDLSSLGNTRIFVVSASPADPSALLLASSRGGNHGILALHAHPLTGGDTAAAMPPALGTLTDPVAQAVFRTLRSDSAAFAGEMAAGGWELSVAVGGVPVHFAAGFRKVAGVPGGGAWWVVTVLDVGAAAGGYAAGKAAVAEGYRAAVASNDAGEKEARAVLAGMAVAACVLAVLLAGACTRAVSAPLLRLSEEMRLVANMSIDMVDDGRPPSALREVEEVEENFRKVCKAIKELRQFVPQAILARSVATMDIHRTYQSVDLFVESDSDDDQDSSSTGSGDVGNNLSHPSKGSLTASNGHAAPSAQAAALSLDKERILSGSDFHRAYTAEISEAGDNNPAAGELQDLVAQVSAGVAGERRAVVSGVELPAAAARVAIGVKRNVSSAAFLAKRRAVTHATVGCRDFDEILKHSADPTYIADFHNGWALCCSGHAKEYGGVVERFVGDVMDVNFNGFNPCVQPAVKAAGYALRVRDRVAAMKAGNEEFNVVEGDLVMGMACGSALVGTLGCQGLKNLAVLGRAVNNSRAMAVVSREIGLDIVIDPRLADEIRGQYRFVPVDVVRLTETGRKQIVSHLLSSRTATAGEWMYTLELATESQYEKAWRCMKNVQDKGLLHVIEALNQVPEDYVARAVALRLKAFSDEYLALSGKPAREYFRVYKPKGLTMSAPDYVRRPSHRALKTNRSMSRPSLGSRRNGSIADSLTSSSSNLVSLAGGLSNHSVRSTAASGNLNVGSPGYRPSVVTDLSDPSRVHSSPSRPSNVCIDPAALDNEVHREDSSFALPRMIPNRSFATTVASTTTSNSGAYLRSPV
ncbi:hypothetical protein DIPPA_09972 [Diplonema papillatum]|nr:hypothetical protein DIPPA_09972 [Diplonema papillatum]